MIFNKRDSDTKQRFGIRKLTIGACSVLLSTLFLTVNNNQTVHASEKDTQPSDEATQNTQETNADSNAAANSALSASLVEEGSHTNNTSEATTARTNANQATASTRATTNQQPAPEVIDNFQAESGTGLVVDKAVIKASDFLSNASEIEAAGGTISWVGQAPSTDFSADDITNMTPMTKQIKVTYGNETPEIVSVTYMPLGRVQAQTFNQGTSFYYVGKTGNTIDPNAVDLNGTAICSAQAQNSLIPTVDDTAGGTIKVDKVEVDTSTIGFHTAKVTVTDDLAAVGGYGIGTTYTVEIPVIVETLPKISDHPEINAQIEQDITSNNGKQNNDITAPNFEFTTSNSSDGFINNGSVFGRLVYQDYLKYYALGGQMATNHTSLGTINNPITKVTFDLTSLENAKPIDLTINWVKTPTITKAGGTSIAGIPLYKNNIKTIYLFRPSDVSSPSDNFSGFYSKLKDWVNDLDKTAAAELAPKITLADGSTTSATHLALIGDMQLSNLGDGSLETTGTGTYSGQFNHIAIAVQYGQINPTTGLPDILSRQSKNLTHEQWLEIQKLNPTLTNSVMWGSGDPDSEHPATNYTPTVYTHFQGSVVLLNIPKAINKTVEIGSTTTLDDLKAQMQASKGIGEHYEATNWPEGTKFDLVDDNGNPISAIEMNTPDATKTAKVKITLPTGVSTLVDVNLKTNPLADNQREVQLQYEYTDASGNVKFYKSQVKVGTIDDIITFDNIAVPESLQDKYDLPAGQGNTIRWIVNASSPQTVTIPLVHKTTTQTEYETRQATVKFLYGGEVTDPDETIIGEYGDTAKPDAVLDIYYKKTTTTDLVTGETTGGTWQFDNSKNDEGYENGYKVVSGDWTLPTDGSNIKVAVPTVDYCTAWTKTSQTNIPTNEFVAPNATSFTPDAIAYEAQAVHTVWYLPIETQHRILTENFIYADDVGGNVQLPAKLYVYYKREATNFDEESHEITYGDWSWDTSQGDSTTPGFKVMNGNWSLPSPDDHQATISVTPPTTDIYTAVTHTAGNSYNSTTFANPYANSNAFTNNTDSNWTYRKTLTTYYVLTHTLTKTITRTISFDDGNLQPQKQRVTFDRVARLNSDDTGVIYGAKIDNNDANFKPGSDQYNHSSSVENASGTWEAYNVKRDGYTALYAIGDDEEYTPLVTNTIPEVTVTPTTKDISLMIKYIKNRATVNFSGDLTHTYSGSQVTLSSDDIRQLSYSVKKANKNMYLPDELNNVSFTADDFSFVNNEGQVIDAPTNVGTYRIILNDHGINTLKKVAEQYSSGYEFSYNPSKQYATYEITPAQASAKLTGTQTETYTGNVINTLSSDINLTITADPSLSYTLQAGDYEFTQNGEVVTPENAGTYNIQLTQAGIEHIKSLGTGNYNWGDITSTAQLVIKKATASYKLSGSQSETYKGSAYAGADLIPAKYSIKITTNNGQTLTYNLQSGDIDFLTGEHPTNKGIYQVGLTEAGLEHLKAINANFDWDTGVSTSTATFEITAQQMIVNIEGEASAIFDNQAQGIPSDQINNIHYTWNSSPTKPSEINSSDLNANDFEYYEKDADGNWKLITENGGLPLHAGKYGVKLKDSVITALNNGNANGNYSFKNGDNISTIFTINQRKARVTLDGSQSAAYTQNGKLNVANFTVKLTDTETGNPITVANANLAPGDLLIKGYDQNGYPKLVGNYDVKMTSAFIKKLEELYPDYQFTSDEVMPSTSAQSENSNSITNSGNTDVTDQNNNGKYIITPLAAEATLSGNQTIKYGQANNIDYSKYSVSLTSNDQPLKDADGHEVTYTLKDGDLKFETVPGNVGDYRVVLSDQGIANLKKLGLNPTIADQNNPEYPSSGTDNYEWSNFTNDTNFVVTAMPVTIAVANGSNGPQTSIYGNQISIDPDKYTITLTTEDGSTLDYTLQAGDLSFKNGTPTSTDTFELELSQQGLTNIEQKFNSSAKNYQFNAPTSTATYVVKAATPTITIKANGNEQKTYNGQPATINSGDYTITITSDAHQYQIGDLDGSSLQFKDSTAPTNVGTYEVDLTSAAINQLKHDYPNFDWDDAVKTVGQYTIVAAKASAKLSGQNSMTYNGQAVTTADLNKDGTIKVVVSINGMTQTIDYKLQDGDYSWDAGQAPVNANDTAYTLSLNKDNVLSHLQDAINEKFGKGQNNQPNVTISADALSGKAEFTINKAQAKVTLAGTQTETYTGSVPTINPDEFTITLDNGKTYTLQAGDLQYVNTAADANKGVGSWQVELTQQGKEHIEAVDSNYNYSFTGNGNVVISKAAVTQDEISFSGDAEKTFDGTPIANYKPTVTITAPGATPVTLDANDYKFVSGNKEFTTAPSNAGEYQVKLTDAGIQKITANNSANLDWSKLDLTKPIGTYTINKATASAVLSGDGSKNYNGVAVSTSDLGNQGIKITITVPVPSENSNSTTIEYTLQDGDYTWETANGQAPVNVGTYNIKLTEQAATNLLNKINENSKLNGNVELKATDITGSAKFTINPAKLTLAQAGSKDQTFNGHNDLTVDQVINGLSASGLVQGQTLNTTGLTMSDFDWYEGQQKLNAAPTNVGNYTVKLNQAGLAKLKQNQGNYTISALPTGSFTYVINAATANAKLAGSSSKTFDGNGTTTAQVNNGNIKVTVTFGNETVEYTLQTGDYTWNTENSQAPVNVGTTQLKLSDAAKARIQAAVNAKFGQGNVKVDELQGTADFTINPFAVTVTTTGQTTVNSGTTTIPNNVYGLSVSANGQMPNGWSGIETSDANFGFTGEAPTADTKSGTFSVNYIGGQAALQNLLGNNYQVTYTPAKNNFIVQDTTPTQGQQIVQYVDQNGTVITSHTVEGNEGSQASFNVGENVPENWQLMNPSDADAQITIAGGTTQFKVEHKLQDLADDTKTVTRTIIEHIPGASQPTTQTQSFEFTRTAKKDLVTGEIIYGNWNAESHNFDVVTPQTVNGYTASPSQVSELVVTPNSGNTTVDVYYTQDPVQGQQIIRFVDNDGNVVKIAGTVTGTDGQSVSVANMNLAGQIPTNWKLADGQELPTSVTISGGYTDIKIVHGTTTQIGSKTVTRIINVTKPDGHVTTTKQEAKFTWTDTVDLVTGQVTEGNWTRDSNDWEEVNIPTIAGYTPTQSIVEAGNPTAETKDQIINIAYNPVEQSVEIKFVDDDNNGAEVSSITEHGVTDQTIDLNLSVPENYELANGQTLPKDYKFKAEDNKPIVIHLVHKLEGTLDTKTITRTIIMNLPNGTKPQVIQTAKLSRTVTKDLVTGKVTYGDWSKGEWDKFTPEAVDGYTANPASVPYVEVNGQNADTTVEINYTKKSAGTEPVSETKTVTRTIIEKLPSGDKVIKQTVTLTRIGTKNLDTGETSWGSWSTGKWDVFPPDQVAGYTASLDLVPEVTVTVDTEDETVVINYTKNEKPTPEKPDDDKTDNNDHIKPTPSKPTYPTNNKGEIVGPDGKVYPAGSIIGPDGSIYAPSGKLLYNAKKKLPQTGKQDNSALAAIGSLFAGLGIFGLAGKRKKKDE